MPNVRHEESLEEIALPECIRASPIPNPSDVEEDASQKVDSLPCHSQYREDCRK